MINQLKRVLGCCARHLNEGVGCYSGTGLSLARILMGFVILYDTFWRWQDARAFYTESGIFPVDLITAGMAGQPATLWGLWLNPDLFGTVESCRLLLGLYGGLALLFILGWKVRFVTVLLWLATIQLHNRNPYVLQGGDTLLRVMLFWMMFVPMAGRWALEKRGPVAAYPARGLPVICLSVQLAFMYFFTALLKTSPEWRVDFTAVHYALHYDLLVTRLGAWVREFHLFTGFLTVTAMILEIVAPLALLVTGRKPRTRKIVIGSMILFHLGLGAHLHLGHFPWVCLAGWLLFWPASGISGNNPAPMNQKVAFSLASWQGLRNSFLCAMLILVACWNIRTTDFQRHSHWFPPQWNPVLQCFRLDQYWDMFAPHPSKDDGWHVVTGTTEKGKAIDLFRGRSANFEERPAHPAEEFSNTRWSKVFGHLRGNGNARVRKSLVEFMRKEWMANHPQEGAIVSITFKFVKEAPPRGIPLRVILESLF